MRRDRPVWSKRQGPLGDKARRVPGLHWACRSVLAAITIVALAAALALGAAGSARAAHWTDIPFPEGQVAQAVVQDSAGNTWSTTIAEDGSYGHVMALWNGATEWQDACEGLNWTLFQWGSGLISVGEKVFLTTSDGRCFTRSADDAAWRAIDAAPQFVRFAEWDGSLWSGSDYLGVSRLDPDSEQSEYVVDGLLVVMDNPGAARAYHTPSGNNDYLYVGCTVSPEVAGAQDFEGVTVYRLGRGGSTWEDTGLVVIPEEGDLDVRGTGDYTGWGVWNVVATDGYVVCQVMIPASGFNVRCFLYDESSSVWTKLTMPDSETGWFYLTSGEPCFVRNGDFYFPTGFVSDGVVCDVLDPASQTWREGVEVEGISWRPLVNTAQIVGDDILVAYSEETGGGATEDDAGSKQLSFVDSVPLPTELSSDPGVIGTNLGLTLLLALVFGFTATLFNSTLEDNHERVARLFSPFARGAKGLSTSAAPPLRRFGNWLKAFTFRSETIRRTAARLPQVGMAWLRPVVIVIVAALIYAFLDPTFGFSGRGANLFFSLAISIAVVTFAYEGVQSLTSTQGYGIPAALRMFPAAIAIAVVCVIVSRLTHFSPGYVYGFVGGMAFLGGFDSEGGKKGRVVLVGAACLLAVSVAAWFIAIPVAEAAAGGSGWATWLETICTAVFVAGLEGLFFGLLPLSVMDGGDLFRWSKVAWAILFAVVVFLFWHVLLNKGSKYGAAFQQSNTQVVLVFLACWTVVTVTLYLLFRKPRPKTPPQPPAPPQPVPPPPPPAPPYR